MSATISKHETFIPGFDTITAGGLPTGRPTLVAGTSGSGKTVFAAQFLAEGIRRGEPGVFVSLEEHGDDIRRIYQSFGWPHEEWEAEGMLRIIDASYDPNDEIIQVGAFDFSALLGRVHLAAEQLGARRISIDSISTLFAQYDQTDAVRRELLRMTLSLKRLNLTAVMTAERVEEYGQVARYGVEEFVADNVIILRNVLEVEKRRRTLEVLKFRAARHQKGEYPFTIVEGTGVVCVPLTAMELTQGSEDVRVPSGNTTLDEMTGGGYFRDSVVLVSGATGTGKTLMVTEFLAAGASRGERCLLLAFEESSAQLHRSAKGWGVDYSEFEEAGTLKVVTAYPESKGLEDHLVDIRAAIDEFQPDRVALDSLSALERVGTNRGAREFILAVTALVKERRIPGLFTSTSSMLLGGAAVTDQHVSTITDTIVLLRYVEVDAEVRRSIVVLKMRGSEHEKAIREFIISSSGMAIGDTFTNVRGILAGNPQQVDIDSDPVREMFIE